MGVYVDFFSSKVFLSSPINICKFVRNDYLLYGNRNDFTHMIFTTCDLSTYVLQNLFTASCSSLLVKMIMMIFHVCV